MFPLLPYSGPNISNKNITILTPLIKQTAEEIKARRFKDPLPIKQTKTTRRKPSNLWNWETWKGEPLKNSAYAACAVEVEIDKKSLRCIIKHIWMQVEVGQIIDRQGLEESINKEIVSTLNWLQNVEPKQRDGEFSSHYFYNRPLLSCSPEIHIGIFENR